MGGQDVYGVELMEYIDMHVRGTWVPYAMHMPSTG